MTRVRIGGLTDGTVEPRTAHDCFFFAGFFWGWFGLEGGEGEGMEETVGWMWDLGEMYRDLVSLFFYFNLSNKCRKFMITIVASVLF